MRINKYLSECGLCSRREADRLIAEGRVTVNGCRAENGMQAEEGDIICVDGRQVCRKREKELSEILISPGGLSVRLTGAWTTTWRII